MARTRPRRSCARRFGALLLFFCLLLLACACRRGAREQREAGEARPSGAPAAGALALEPPAVPNAAQARKHAGTRLTYYADSVGIGFEIDKAMARRFQDDTGIAVRLIPRPKDATETYAVYQRLFQARSPSVDALMLDAIWTGALADNLVDLSAALGEAAAQHLRSLVENNTIAGRLVAMPWFVDFGLLYYRTDLLAKYGYTRPPRTWDELEQMASTIQAGEQKVRRGFAGFVFQGKAYEGLTCNALEWIASHGGGRIVDDGRITVNNPRARKALSRARGWVGTISPIGVTGYEEEDARNAFQGGNAAFMRNWPYAYSAGNAEGSKVKGLFGVAPLPHEPGERSAATIGGWQLGVSRYSTKREPAIELVRYLTSPEAQKFRAKVGSFLPTVRALHEDPDVLQALPFLSGMGEVWLVARPAAQAGARYNELSIGFFQGVSSVLLGKAPRLALEQMERRLQRALEARSGRPRAARPPVEPFRWQESP